MSSQTLFLLNGPLLKTASQTLAQEVIANSTLTSEAEKVTSLYLRILNRPPSPDEISAARTFLTTPDDVVAGVTPPAVDPNLQLQRLIHALMASNEFLFRL